MFGNHRDNRSETIRSAVINSRTTLISVIASVLVAVLGSVLTSYVAVTVAGQQISGEDARSRAEFLTEQRRTAYLDFLADVDDFLGKAKQLAGASPTESQLTDATEAMGELGRSVTEINLLGSNEVSAIVDEISLATGPVLVAAVSGQGIDPKQYETIMDLKLRFSFAARKDLLGD